MRSLPRSAGPRRSGTLRTLDVVEAAQRAVQDVAVEEDQRGAGLDLRRRRDMLLDGQVRQEAAHLGFRQLGGAVCRERK